MQIDSISRSSSFFFHMPDECIKIKQPAQRENEDSFTPSGNISQPFMLSGKLPALFGFEPQVAGKISIDELYSHGQDFLQKFNDQLRSIMNECGIDDSVPFDLKSEYGSGDVIVSSGHPEKEKIEKLFEENFDLRNEFTKINNMLTIVQSAKDSSSFRSAYQHNQTQAVAQYSWVFNTHLEATMRISEIEPQMIFERLPNV